MVYLIIFVVCLILFIFLSGNSVKKEFTDNKKEIEQLTILKEEAEKLLKDAERIKEFIEKSSETDSIELTVQLLSEIHEWKQKESSKKIWNEGITFLYMMMVSFMWGKIDGLNRSVNINDKTDLIEKLNSLSEDKIQWRM